VIFVALCIWIVFCVRDFCLLQTGPANDFRKHARWYSVSVLLTAAVFCLARALAGPAQVRSIVLAPAFLGAAIAGHLLTTAASIWLDRSGLHASGWVLALVPVPASWIFLVMTANSVYAVVAGAAAWVCLIAVAARLDRRETVTAEDLDFSLQFAGWSNSMAVCLVPLLLQ
jgi:hypothetical protein